MLWPEMTLRGPCLFKTPIPLWPNISTFKQRGRPGTARGWPAPGTKTPPPFTLHPEIPSLLDLPPGWPRGFSFPPQPKSGKIVRRTGKTGGATRWSGCEAEDTSRGTQDSHASCPQDLGTKGLKLGLGRDCHLGWNAIDMEVGTPRCSYQLPSQWHFNRSI